MLTKTSKLAKPVYYILLDLWLEYRRTTSMRQIKGTLGMYVIIGVSLPLLLTRDLWPLTTRTVYSSFTAYIVLFEQT